LVAAAEMRDNGLPRMTTPPEFPTDWQKKVIWRALSALSIACIFTVSVGFLYVFSRVMAFMQPILVPFAIAGVLAYLLEPVVVRLVRLGTTRHRAVSGVFIITTLALVGILFWIIPVISTQTVKLATKVPDISYKVRLGVATFAIKVRDQYGLKLLPEEMLTLPKKAPAPVDGETKSDPTKPAAESDPSATAESTAGEKKSQQVAAAVNAANAATQAADAAVKAASAVVAVASKDAPPAASASPLPTVNAEKPAKADENPEESFHKLASGDWVSDALPSIARNVWGFLSASLGGFLGFFGFLLSLVIVPLYLFYFLTESPHIATGWTAYVPLKKSDFKDEVVSCLTEINGYLIAFFRGQLIVSLINGVATGVLLASAGLDFGILIGFALCFLGIIPYLGIVMCWIPAVIIASVQGGSWMVPADASWWVFPLIVTGIFAVVQQVDGLFITPKIVGERVGLHPVTVIFSVFLWSLLLGGLLGAILAVPLTATAKVILKRYVWDRAIGTPPAAPA
jgi:predicted PurR-regulated permease PerM